MNRKPMTAEQQALAVKYIPLARSLAKPFKLAWPTHRDDFDSAAMGALCEAANAFDPDRGVKFSTFLHHRVRGGLKDAQRALIVLGFRCEPQSAPTLTSLPKDAEGKGRVIGRDSNRDPAAEAEASDAFERAIRALPDRHARICRAMYVDGMSQHQAARVFGISQSRLWSMHREAKAMLDGSWETAIRESA